MIASKMECLISLLISLTYDQCVVVVFVVSKKEKGASKQSNASSLDLNHGTIVKSPHGSFNIIVESDCFWDGDLLLY